MKKRTFSHEQAVIDYYQEGKHPRFLFTAGIHGDEYQVIDSVRRCLERFSGLLPPYLFIPAVSPSAIVSRTRLNGEGLDLNRQFRAESPSAEARALMAFLTEQKFSLALSWHEDLAADKFYFYDSQDMEKEEGGRLVRLRQSLGAAGVGLLNGPDDTEDICLGFNFVDGYQVCLPNSAGRLAGTLESWLVTSGTAGRVHGLEVPGQASPEIKNKVVVIVFQRLFLS